MRIRSALTTALVGGFLTLSASKFAAEAHPVWAPPLEWGPGWHRWMGHHPLHPDWAGPVWFSGPGPRHGWYFFHDRWYRFCGWHHPLPGVVEWRCS